MTKHIQQGDVDLIVTDPLHDGDPASPQNGLAATTLLRIYRESDRYFWDFGDSSFKAGGHSQITQAMALLDAINAPGVYYYAWTTPAADDTYHYIVSETSATAKNVPQTGQVLVGQWVDDIDTAISSRAAPGDAMELNAAGVTDVQSAMTAQGYDTTRAPYLDELAAANIPADVDTLLSRLTVGRATNLDNLDAAVSSRSDFDETTDPVELLDSGGAAGTSAAELVADTASYLETSGPNPHGTGAWDGAGGLTAQEVRDAMKLAPTGGAPAAGSVDEALDNIEADTAAIEPLTTANLDATVSSRATPADVATAESNIRGADSRDLSELAGAGWSAATDTLEEIADAIAAIGGGVADWTTAEKEDIRDALGVTGTKGSASGGQLQDIPADVDTQLTGTHGAGSWQQSAGSTDWTSGEREQIRDALGVAGTKTPASGGQLQDVASDAGDVEGRLTPTRASNLDNLDATVSSRAVPGQAMDLVTDAVDANAMATSGAQEIRDEILSDSTPFNGADIDAAITTRAAPGDAMDLVADAVDAASLAVSAASEVATAVETLQAGIHGAGSWQGSGITAQQVRDAMKLAPTGGAPAGGSVDEHLDNIEADTGALDARVPADPADESNQNAQHATTQAAVAGLNDLDQAGVQAAMTAQGYTTPRGVNLDKLDAAITTRSSHDEADVDTQLSGVHGAGNWEGGAGLTQQNIRDAMKLAPSPGAPVGGSVDEHLDDIETAAQAVDTRLPTDPADESNLQAQHATTQAAIGALNDIDQAQVQAALNAQGYTSVRATALDATNAAAVAVDARLPTDPADESNLQAQHAATQAAIAALNNLAQADVQAALTAQGYTSVRAALLDNLDAAISGLVTDVASVQTDTTELLARLTLARAAALDSITGISTSTTLLRKIQTNRLELAEGDPGIWTLYDDNDVDTLLTWQVRDKGGFEIRMDSFVPARRTKAV